jgi:hypothetical protein
MPQLQPRTQSREAQGATAEKAARTQFRQAAASRASGLPGAVRRPLLALQSFALAVVLMCPAPGGFGDRAIGSPDGDGPKHLWTLWWMKTEALSGEPGLLTRYVNFPAGLHLYPIDPLDGLVAVLLPLPPVTLSNLLALVHLTVLGMCAGWLGKLVSGSRLGGYVAGALAQGSAFAAFTLHVGVGELRQLWWLPLGMGCLLRAHETGTRKWFVALGLVGAGATLSCFYHGAFLGIAAGTWLLFRRPRGVRAWGNHALALGLALLLALPAVGSFARSFGGPAAAPTAEVGEPAAPANDDVGAAAAIDDLYLPRSPARARLDAEQRAYTGGRYLGLIAVCLALAGLAAAPRRALPWAAVAVLGAALSFGSVPTTGGAALGGEGSPLGLPFQWLNAALARVAEPINFPARFLALTMMALPMLAGLATRWRWTALLVPLAIVEVQVADLVPWPRESFFLPPVTGLAGKGPILDLGVALDDSRASRQLNMSVQMALSSPTQVVPIDRLDRWHNDGARWARALPLAQDLLNRRPGPENVEAGYREDLALLHSRGFERLLITHPSDALDPQFDGLLTALCGPPQRAELATLWTLPVPEASMEELAAWTTAQDARVAALPETDTPGHYPTSPALQ